MPKRNLPAAVFRVVGLALFAAAALFVWRLPSLPLAGLLFGLLVATFALVRPWLWPAEGFRWPRALSVFGPPLAIVALSVFRLWPASLGAPLVRNDHSIHMFKAWVLSHELLPQGRLGGWSHHLFAGYPASELYPPGGELWVTLWDLLTLRLLPFPSLYAIAFTAFFAFSGLAVYWFGKHFGGRALGFLAAVFLLFDHGEFRQAGWHYVVSYGVWAQSLGLAWFLLAFVRFDLLLERRRLRDLIGFALLAGLAILSHPMNLMTMALGLPLLLLLWWLRGGGRLRDVALPVAGALGLAALLAASWLLPFIARKSLTTSIGVVWEGMDVLGRRFLEGDLFGGTAAFVSVLGLLGAALALRSRRPLLPAVVVLAVFTVFLSTSTVVIDFDLLSLSESFRKIQYERFVTQAKPLWFVLAAFALVETLRAGRTRLASERSGAAGGPWRRALFALVVGAMLFVAARPALDAAGRAYFGTHPQTARTHGQWSDFEAAAAFLREQAPDEWWRLAVVDSEHSHELFLLATLVARPTIKIGYTPAENYRFRIERSDYQLLRKLGVRYLVARAERKHRLLGPPQRFGDLWVHPLVEPGLSPYELQGEGEVRLESFEDEHIALRLTGCADEARLSLLVGYHPRWRATLDGEPVAIRERSYRGPAHSLHVMEVDAADGLLELRYGAEPVDRIATASGLVSLAVMAALALLTGLPPLRRRLWAPMASWYGVHRGRVGAVVLGLGGGVFLVLGALFLWRALSVEGERTLFRASDHVSEARVWYRAGAEGGDLACEDWDGRRWTCAGQERNWRFVGVVAKSFADVPMRCIWAHPIKGRRLEIVYPEAPLGAAVAGFVGIEDDAVRKKGRGGAEVTLEVLLDGVELGRTTRRNEEGAQDFRFDSPGAPGRRGELRFRVTSPDDHWRNFCFEARTLQ